MVPPDELHRVVCTALVYNSEGRYLIAKRSPHKIFPNKWHIPGGGISMNDYKDLPSSTPNMRQWYGALEFSLKREIKEEVNIEIDNIEYLEDVAFIRENDGVPVIVLSYFAKHVSGEVKLNDGENVDFAWITADEAEKYDLIDGILGEIQDVDKILKSRNLKAES